MRIWKSDSLLNLVNGYLVDSPQSNKLTLFLAFTTIATIIKTIGLMVKPLQSQFLYILFIPLSTLQF